MIKSYYDILNLKDDATKAQIKAQFKKFAKMYHPDVNSSFEAELRFKEINKAASVLLDDEKRKKYDSLRKTTFSQTKNVPVDGEDITVEIKIDYSEAVIGTYRIINIAQSTPCPKCGGHKFANGQKCPICQGKGELTENRKITVKIPRAIKNKTKLRLKGEGNSGKYGGKRGNLYVIVEVEKKIQHENLKIENGIVYFEAQISPYTAVLGGDVQVETLWGLTSIKIPALTKNFQSFKLVNVGVLDEKTNKKGDEIVKIIIQTPSSLTDEEYRLYERLREINLNKKNAKI
ncbi:DnaJ domain-containing protein [bacterium]|nr:DnaJ domain-containing protein [bacterium]